MTTPEALGISGAILDILQDPIAAIALARQIDREHGQGTTLHLQEAAMASIVPVTLKEHDHDRRSAKAA